MNVALRQPMSLEEFLVWEERQEVRHEFDGLRPVAMVGGLPSTRPYSPMSFRLSAWD